MDLIEMLMAMSGTPEQQPPQQGNVYTDILTGTEYPTLEAFLAGRAESDRRRMGNIQGGSGPSAFSVGFSGGFA